MADLDVLAALEQARHGRVDLGAFTVEELWRAGLEVRGAKTRPDPPPLSRLPLDADAIKAHVHTFFDALWDVPGPGPEPGTR